MKYQLYLTPEQFAEIEPHIDCREWANPIEDHYVFYDPTPSFEIILALFGHPMAKDT